MKFNEMKDGLEPAYNVGKTIKTDTNPDSPQRYAVLNKELDNFPIRVVYPKLLAKLQTDIKRCGDAKLRQLVFEAPEDKRISGYIYAVAKEEHQRIKDEFDKQMGQWTVWAREELAKLKKDKKWDGQVYPSDVDRYIAARMDGYNEYKEALRKAERAERAAKALFESYKDRLSSLQTYARLLDRIPVDLSKGAARGD